MEFSVCQVCLSHYSERSVPMVLNCGHTFCNICISKCSRCPMCREDVKVLAKNLVVSQASGKSSEECKDPNKELYCPVCEIGVCLKCIVYHNTHGLLLASDSQTSYLIRSKIQDLLGKIEQKNKNIRADMDSISHLHQYLNSQMYEIIENVKFEFNEIRKTLDFRQAEITDDVLSLFKPLNSKLETILYQFDRTLEHNNKEKEDIEEIKDLDVEKQIGCMRKFSVKYIRTQAVEIIKEKLKSLSPLELNSSTVKQEISKLGKFIH